MRMLLVAALLIASPAYAEPNLYFEYLHQQNLKKAARVQAARNEHAAHVALCAKIGGARVGLNSEGVLKSCWGKPSRVNTTQTATGRHEQWVYATGDFLYLTDGIVTAIQTTR
jgi:hypothetical protein